MEQDNTPRTLYLKLSAYDILNPDAFYNKKRKENVSLHWDPDIVANEKEVERKLEERKSMINFEEELKNFQPSLEVEEAEEAIYNHKLTDMTDVLEEMMKEMKRNM